MIARGPAQRLMAAVHVDDRQPAMTEPPAAEAELSLVVGPAVLQAREHALILARDARPQAAGDSAHQAALARGTDAGMALMP